MAINKVSKQVLKSGAVLQCATTSIGHAVSTTSTSFVDSGISITLNNVRAGSKIVVDLVGVMLHKNGAGNFTYGQILRDNAAMDLCNQGLTVTGVALYSPFVMMAVQNSETAGNHTYKFQWRVDGGGCETYGPCIMRVMEIAP
jgi:hypothetical protein